MNPEKKSQSIVDFVIAIIAITGLVVGIARIWIWFNANYAKRQLAFQQSRIIAAGRERPDYEAEKKPVNIGRTKECPNCKYSNLELTENWVFKGLPSGTIRGAFGEGEQPLLPSAGCDLQCQEQCAADPSCMTPEGAFDYKCGCYVKCEAECYCKTQIEPQAKVYNDQVRQTCGDDMNCDSCNFAECDTGNCGTACSMRKNAQSLLDAASNCDDIWDICWWGSWGSTAEELRKGAIDLTINAIIMENRGRAMQLFKDKIMVCCNKENVDLQTACLEKLKDESQCDERCFEKYKTIFEVCPASECGKRGCGGSWQCQLQAMKPCDTYAYGQYQACFNPCVACMSTCKDNENCREGCLTGN